MVYTNQQEEIETNLKLIAKSSIAVFLGLFFAKVFTYLYRIIIARNFGPEEYGLFSLGLMIFGFFSTLSLLGFSEGLLRYIPIYRGEGQENKIKYSLRYSILTSFFLSILFGSILFLSSRVISLNFFHNEALTPYLVFFSFLLPLFVISQILLAVLRSFEKVFWYSFISNFAFNFVKFAFLVIFILIGFKVNSIIFSYFLGFFVVSFLSFLFCKHLLPGIFMGYELKKLEKIKIKKEFISYSWPIMFLGMISSIFYWTDSFFIGNLKGVLQVGLYNSVVPIALLLLVAPSLFTTLFFPLITKQYSSKKLSIVKETSKQVTKWIFMINLPLFLFQILFPGAFINLFFGSEYLVAQNSLRILSLGVFITSIVTIPYQLISIVGKSKLLLIDMLLVSILNIFLNYLFIPAKRIFFLENSLGINGASLATTVSMIVLNTIFLFQAKQRFSFFPFKENMSKILLVSFIPLTLVFLFRVLISPSLLGIFLLAFLFVGLYFLLIFVTKCFDSNDVLVLKRIRGKF